LPDDEELMASGVELILLCFHNCYEFRIFTDYGSHDVEIHWCCVSHTVDLLLKHDDTCNSDTN
jgi:hypothetical protein